MWRWDKRHVCVSVLSSFLVMWWRVERARNFFWFWHKFSVWQRTFFPHLFIRFEWIPSIFLLRGKWNEKKTKNFPWWSWPRDLFSIYCTYQSVISPNLWKIFSLFGRVRMKETWHGERGGEREKGRTQKKNIIMKKVRALAGTNVNMTNCKWLKESLGRCNRETYEIRLIAQPDYYYGFTLLSQ